MNEKHPETVGLTKKERRELRKQAPAKKPVNSWLLWGGVLLAVVAIMAWLLTAGTGSSTNNSIEGTLAGQEVSSEEWIKGNVDAPVTLIEYSDFQCPACRAIYPVLKDMSQTYPDQLRIVYRHFPLDQIHPQARLAAQAAEAAGLQGQFWQMHDLLFETQSEWGPTQPHKPTAEVREHFLGLAAQLELDIEQFESDWESDAVKNAVTDDYRAGQQARVSGTPSFVLNGKKVDNKVMVDEVIRLIEELGQ
jgi:protein-disulfide isomerase